jgi:hypothetical protein
LPGSVGCDEPFEQVRENGKGVNVFGERRIEAGRLGAIAAAEDGRCSFTGGRRRPVGWITAAARLEGRQNDQEQSKPGVHNCMVSCRKSTVDRSASHNRQKSS